MEGKFYFCTAFLTKPPSNHNDDEIHCLLSIFTYYISPHFRSDVNCNIAALSSLVKFTILKSITFGSPWHIQLDSVERVAHWASLYRALGGKN